MRVTLVDNYDSFTWNLVHLIGGCGATVGVVRNDERSVGALLDDAPDAFVLSPGPCTPNEAGICCGLIAKAGPRVPIFGVCLGHQAIGQVYGGDVVRNRPVHGKLSTIRHEGETLFRGINGPFEATRYHSLVVERATCPSDLLVTATSEDDGAIMGLSHRAHPVHGVQFHPESILSQHGATIVRNFLTLAEAWNRSSRSKAA